MYSNKLRTLKKTGDNTVKDYYLPIPDECMVIIEDWLISYCTEETSFNTQKTLGFSRKDKQPFSEDHIIKEFPDIWKIFGDYQMWWVKQFPSRGYTRLYILK